jgi:SAM-dependent methyltransferase
VESEPGSLAAYFDGWYADMTESPVKDEIQQRHLGLPPYLLSTSLLGWDGIAEVVAALRLSPGGALVDLACGRGGYGLEIAARTGARLTGVDFSAEAVRQAREQARRLGATADFRLGDLSATGLEAGSADAVLCVDAIQFAPEPDAAYHEIRRILTPAGRVVLTCWEPRRAVMLNHIMDGDHAGVIQPGRRPRLPHRAGDQVGMLMRGLRREQDLLDRHHAVQQLIVTAPHPAHPRPGLRAQPAGTARQPEPPHAAWQDHRREATHRGIQRQSLITLSPGNIAFCLSRANFEMSVVGMRLLTELSSSCFCLAT